MIGLIAHQRRAPRGGQPASNAAAHSTLSPASSPHPLLALQRTQGNQAVQRLLHARPLATPMLLGAQSLGNQALQRLLSESAPHRESLAARLAPRPSSDDAVASDGAGRSAAPVLQRNRNAPPALSMAPPISVGAADSTIIQRGKSKRLGVRASALKRKINARLNLLDPNSQAFSDFNDLIDQLDEATRLELDGVENAYARLCRKHHVALGQGGPPPHPAGAQHVDPQGYLVAPYDTQIRTHFYPSGYNVAALNAKQAWIIAHTDPITNLVQCGCGQVPASAMTIDHVTPVAQHWNTGGAGYPAGRNSDKATRIAFYNDVTNHEYVCGPCNSSMGSGGIFYNKKVGQNFRVT